MMVGKTATQNKADKARMEAIVEIGCLPCLIEGWPNVPTTIQHVTDAGRRLEHEHQNTYGACPWHHLGQVPMGCHRLNGSLTLAEGRFGPSLAHSKARFIARYGKEMRLIHITDALVRVYHRAKSRGEFMVGNEWMRIARALHQEISS